MVTKKLDDESEPGAYEPDGFDRELEGYRAVTEDEGYDIDFEKTPVFKGTFLRIATHSTENPEEDAAAGRPTTWEQLLFRDEKGELCNTSSNYRLDQALATGELTEGVQVLIKHHGKKELKGGQTLNRISVYVKN